MLFGTMEEEQKGRRSRVSKVLTFIVLRSPTLKSIKYETLLLTLFAHFLI